MVKEYLQIAGFTIAVHFNLRVEDFDTNYFFYKLFRDYYKGFLYNISGVTKVDFNIILEPRVKIDVVMNKKEQSVFLLFYKRLNSHSLKSNFDIGIIQFSLLLREVLQELLSKNDGFILHGSAIAIHKGAVIFSGKSGAGKSTLVKILESKFQPLADDMIIIRKSKNAWYVYQTPFFEKNYLFSRGSQSFKLRALLEPKKSKDYYINYIENRDWQFKLLTTQFFSSSEAVVSQVKSLQALIDSKQVSLGEIHFDLKDKGRVVSLLRNYEGKA